MFFPEEFLHLLRNFIHLGPFCENLHTRCVRGVVKKRIFYGQADRKEGGWGGHPHRP